MKITVVGTGYVGLVTGACLSEFGNHVLCMDVDPRKIEILQGGGLPIDEPGLLDIVQRNAQGGRLEFTTDRPSRRNLTAGIRQRVTWLRTCLTT